MRRAVVATATTALFALFAIFASAATATTPSLRLIAAQDQIRVNRYNGGLDLYNLPIYVASTDGHFQVNATRPGGFGEWSLAQVELDGTPLRTLPSELFEGGAFSDFFRVTLLAPDGTSVAQTRSDFCPLGYDRQRIGQNGPAISSFPLTGCYESFPFAIGQVLGVDEEWAVSGFENAPMLRARPGTYTLRVQIRRPFRHALAIPADDAIVEVELTTGEHSGHLIERPHPIAKHRSAAAERRAAPPLDTSPDPSTVSDLVAAPPWRIRIESHRRNDLLTFAATIWNRGPAALTVEGFRRDDDPEVMDAFQYFSDSSGEQVGMAPTGRFEYHHARGHNHWHFLQFGRYSLLDSTGSEVLRSHKQSFCIVPTDSVDLTVPNANWNPNATGFGYSTCGSRRSLWIREVLDVGWGDTYTQAVAGQALNVSDLPNGSYLLEVRANPTGLLYDADASNDTIRRRVELGGIAGDRTISVDPWDGVSD